MIDILAQSQACVPVYAQHKGFVVILLEPTLFETHKLICTNRAAQVKSDRMFWLVNENCVNEGPNRHINISIPKCVPASALMTHKILGSVYNKPFSEEANKNNNFHQDFL